MAAKCKKMHRKAPFVALVVALVTGLNLPAQDLDQDSLDRLFQAQRPPCLQTLLRC